MNVIKVPISQLVNDPNNARKHGTKNISAIKGSLAKFGQQKPIVIDAKNIIIAGNGTLEAAKQLGWTHINAVVTELDDLGKMAFALADNKTSELAEWDDPILAEQLDWLDKQDFDISDIGFEDYELPGESKGTDGLTDPDEVPEVPQNVFGVKRGDIWLLGNHRLMCGDSTSEDDVKMLMNGKKADIVFTDPPYKQDININGFLASRKSFNKLAESTNLNDFNPEKLFIILTKLDVKSFYVHFNKELIVDYINYAKNENRLWDLLAIVKNNPMPIKSNKFLSDIEWILFSRKNGSYFDDSHNYDWYRKAQKVNVKPSEFGHPTEKWVGLIEQYISISSIKNDIVIDLFLGSGSTLIACEKTGRICYGMELDEHYCSVVIKRWQDFTGKTAIKEV